jgi:sigma-E factor negative regulatory protein RseB
MTPASRWVGLAACLATSAFAGSADVDPHQLLEKMNSAVRQLDYEGRFVVQSDERLDALYIVHRVDDGAEKERVVSLTGEPREIIRNGLAVACLVPGHNRTINVGRNVNGRSFTPLQSVSREQLDESYRMEVLPPVIVAGRKAHQIVIRPRDKMRYGYRLSIDQASGLPLRSVMYGENNEVVTQMMFVELRVDDSITPVERDISAMQAARADPPEIKVGEERLAPPEWVFAELPRGYQLNVHRRRPGSADRSAVEHFIFSDGLASVSVYVQPSSGEGGFNGVSRLAVGHAVGRVVDQHEIVVVGDVPLKTLHWFAQNIRPASP